jgi:hypothetical protein
MLDGLSFESRSPSRRRADRWPARPASLPRGEPRASGARRVSARIREVLSRTSPSQTDDQRAVGLADVLSRGASIFSPDVEATPALFASTPVSSFIISHSWSASRWDKYAGLLYRTSLVPALASLLACALFVVGVLHAMATLEYAEQPEQPGEEPIGAYCQLGTAPSAHESCTRESPSAAVRPLFVADSHSERPERDAWPCAWPSRPPPCARRLPRTELPSNDLATWREIHENGQVVLMRCTLNEGGPLGPAGRRRRSGSWTAE